jgi:hypothetical protein
LLVLAAAGGALFLAVPDGSQQPASVQPAQAPAIEILSPDDAAARP